MGLMTTVCPRSPVCEITQAVWTACGSRSVLRRLLSELTQPSWRCSMRSRLLFSNSARTLVKIALVLAMLLFLSERQIALAQSWQAGFDFRATQGFVTDPAGDYAVLGKATLYPKTTNGVTYGWA